MPDSSHTPARSRTSIVCAVVSSTHETVAAWVGQGSGLAWPSPGRSFADLMKQALGPDVSALVSAGLPFGERGRDMTTRAALTGLVAMTATAGCSCSAQSWAQLSSQVEERCRLTPPLRSGRRVSGFRARGPHSSHSSSELPSRLLSKRTNPRQGERRCHGESWSCLLYTSDAADE